MGWLSLSSGGRRKKLLSYSNSSFGGGVRWRIPVVAKSPYRIASQTFFFLLFSFMVNLMPLAFENRVCERISQEILGINSNLNAEYLCELKVKLVQLN